MTAALAIEVTGNATDAANALDSVGDSAERMADRVEAASRSAETAAGGLDRVGESADNLDDKAGRATGALGALASGFELAGAEQYAGALQGAALATDFLSGVGQALTLVTEAQGLANIRATVTTKAKAAAERVGAAATRVMAAGQWALNAAMSANPIGLVILAVVALVAIFVVAYKKSETFRNIVNAVMEAVKGKIDQVVDVVQVLVTWVKDKLTTAFQNAKDVAGRVWQAIKDGIDVATKPLQAVVDLIQNIIDKLKNINWPEPPGWMKKIGEGAGKLFSVGTDSAVMGGAGVGGGGVTLLMPVTIGVATDPAGTARQLEGIAQRASRRVGGWSSPW